MKFFRLPALYLFLSLFHAAFLPSEEQQETDLLRGFSAATSEIQKKVEEVFQQMPSAERAREHHRFFTAEPHPAGSDRNRELALHISKLWKRQGLEDLKIHRYDVLVSFPREVVVEMVSPKPYRATLREDSYEVDPDTSNPKVLGGYIGLSASGEVTAPVVYAHSGNPSDYDVLRKHGIDVKGKIVLVRYSNPYSYRGFKALTAQVQGAAGMLIYSDPAEDGFVRGKTFPDGPWGPESHIQRGAITYDFLVAGDPLTPGWPSLPDAKRIPMEEAISLPKIMAAPLSWRDAKPLLENMGGPEAPAEWQGGLPLKYHMGGEGILVHMKVKMDTGIKPNYVVEGRIRGAEFPDEWIILGNHRDAWEFGGVDPSSGTASLMELTHSMGQLLQKGMRPKRTLVFCSWDGEEVALTGSTEWGEHFAQELKDKAIAYLNVDSSASGPDFQASAVASLAPLLVEVSRTLKAPSGKTLYEEWKSTRLRQLREEGKEDVTDAVLANTRIGSGTDHTVFLNHLGIPVFDLTFDGPYGVYHSVYDNFYWMNHFGDPGYRYHVLMSKVWGLLALRLANAEIVPFDFAFYADNIRQFLRELPKAEETRKKLDLDRTGKLIHEFEKAGVEWNEAVRTKLRMESCGTPVCKDINRKLKQVEWNWLNSSGIPGRSWFKHLLYAARYTYDHLELPGITEAIEAGNWQLAADQVLLLEQALSRNTKLLQDVRAELLPIAPPALTRDSQK